MCKTIYNSKMTIKQSYDQHNFLKILNVHVADIKNTEKMILIKQTKI